MGKSKKHPQLTFHQLDWLEYITLGIGTWFIVYPKPYGILFSILICIPIVGLILNGITGRPSIASLVKITKDDDGDDKYDVADFIDFAALSLLVRILIDYEFESLYSLIIPGMIAFVLMLILLFTTHSYIVKTTKSKFWIYTSLIFNIFLYSYVTTYGMNCVYDNSKPKIYKATVLDKHISTSSKGRKTYYVTVTPWGHHYDEEDISVTNEQYNTIDIGNNVDIDLMNGLFGIKWFYVE